MTPPTATYHPSKLENTPRRPGRRLDRRKFLQGTAAAALISALHPESLFASAKNPSALDPSGAPRILKLRLQTAAALDALKDFYHDQLGFPVVAHSAEQLTFRGGQTEITFQRTTAVAADDEVAPWYHVAFNIPQNKLLAARAWHLRRGPLITTPERLRDPEFPDDVRHFRNWNAHSLFFWDPAGNLLEYIARHDLSNDTPGDFTSKDLLYASEIGFIVDDQQVAAEELHRELGVAAYPKGTERWWSMGDELGLLLCLRQRDWATGTVDSKTFGVYPTHATVRGSQPKSFAFNNYPYTVEMI